MLVQQQPVSRFLMQITEAYLQSEEFSNLNKIREMIRSSYQMAAAPFRFLSLLREHQPEKGFFKWFAVSACNRNTLPGFHEDFGRVEMVYIRKVDKVTAVTLEKVVFFQKLIFHNMKWSDGRDDLSCPQIKKHFFILGFGKFDVMKIHPLIALRCFQNHIFLLDGACMAAFIQCFL